MAQQQEYVATQDGGFNRIVTSEFALLLEIESWTCSIAEAQATADKYGRMPPPTVEMVRFKFERRSDGQWSVTSPDFPDFFTMDRDLNSIIEELPARMATWPRRQKKEANRPLMQLLAGGT